MNDILEIMADVLIDGGCTDSYSVAEAALTALRAANFQVVRWERVDKLPVYSTYWYEDEKLIHMDDDVGASVLTGLQPPQAGDKS